MADAFYHASQLLFFGLSAAFLIGMLQQNRAAVPSSVASLADTDKPGS